MLATDCSSSSSAAASPSYLKLHTWFSSLHIIQTQNFLVRFDRLRRFYQLVANGCVYE